METLHTLLRAPNRLNARLRGGILLLAATLCGWLILRKGVQPGITGTLRAHWPVVFLGWCLANAFVIFKSKALQTAAAVAGLSVSWLRAGRLFCEGTVVDLLTWPGKLWCDAYRVSLLPGDSLRAKVHTMLRFRAGGLAGTLVVLSASLAVVADHLAPRADRLLMIVPVAMIALVATGCVLRRAKAGVIASMLPVVAWSLPATLCDAVTFGLIAHLLTGATPILLASWYVVLNTVSTLSTLPMNIGVFDVACWMVLTRLLGADSATVATAIAVHRTIGPLNTVVIGALSAMVRGLGLQTPGLPMEAACSSERNMLMRTPETP